MQGKSVFSPVADELRRLREARGLSRQEIANRIGRSKDMLRAYERGRSVPPISVAFVWARTLGRKLKLTVGR